MESYEEALDRLASPLESDLDPLSFPLTKTWTDPKAWLDYEHMAVELLAVSDYILCDRWGMEIMPSGGLMVPNIKVIGSAFNINHVVSIDEARAIMLDSVTSYLKNFNQSEKIRPHLDHYPLKPEDFRIYAWPWDEKNGKIR